MTHIMHTIKDLSALVSLFQQCLGPISFIVVGAKDYLPEVHPSGTHVSARKGDGHVHWNSRLGKGQTEETTINS